MLPLTITSLKRGVNETSFVACYKCDSHLFSNTIRHRRNKRMEHLPRTARTTLKRLPKRGSHEREVIDRILDEGFICHVGFVVNGQPFVIPTGYARVEDNLIVHGSQASRMLRALGQGIDVCVTVTLIDGLVLARSAFHHSMNYRSVMVFGRAERVVDPDEQYESMVAIVEHLVPGRSRDTRLPTSEELRKTVIVRLPLGECSAKVRTGGPLDDDDDM